MKYICGLYFITCAYCLGYTDANDTTNISMNCTSTKCYHHIPVDSGDVDYITAQSVCEERNMTMATVDTVEELVHFENITLGRTEPGYWLGATRQVFDYFTWLNGTTVADDEIEYLDVQDQESDDYRYGERCGVVHNNSTTWGVQRCSDTNPYICQTPEQLGCQVQTQAASWHGAKYKCESYNMTLLVAGSVEEVIERCDDDVERYIDSRYWVGLRKSVWRWQGGCEVMHSTWETNLQSIYGKKCLQVGDSGLWRDANCCASGKVLCQNTAVETCVNASETITDSDSCMNETYTRAPMSTSSDGPSSNFLVLIVSLVSAVVVITIAITVVLFLWKRRMVGKKSKNQIYENDTTSFPAALPVSPTSGNIHTDQQNNNTTDALYETMADGSGQSQVSNSPNDQSPASTSQASQSGDAISNGDAGGQQDVYAQPHKGRKQDIYAQPHKNRAQDIYAQPHKNSK